MTKTKILPSILLLPSRLLLFFLFQMCLAQILSSFDYSVKYWILIATVTNIISIAILVFLFQLQNMRFLDLFSFDRLTFKKDIILFLFITLLCGPIVFIPNYLLSIWLWGDPDIPYNMMFGPIPLPVVYFLLLVFPVSIAFAELATYFGYIMPQLVSHLKTKWFAIALPVIFLSIQHCTLPFIPDFKFIIYRALMYFPFAGMLGIIIYLRPRLFPYFVIMHGLLDFATVIVLLRISSN